MNVTVKAYGATYECEVYLAEYTNGGYAIQMTDKEDGCPWATASVWVEGINDSEVAIPTHNGEHNMLALIEGGLIEAPHRYVPSGYVMIPVCKWNQEKLNDLIKQM